MRQFVIAATSCILAIAACGTAPESTAVEGVNTPRCTTPGYDSASDGSCVDHDECGNSPSPCTEGTACANTEGSFRCDCPPGAIIDRGTCVPLDGKKCNDDADCSRGTPCSSRAECVAKGETFVCIRTNGTRLCRDSAPCGDDCSCLGQMYCYGGYYQCPNWPENMCQFK